MALTDAILTDWFLGTPADPAGSLSVTLDFMFLCLPSGTVAPFQGEKSTTEFLRMLCQIPSWSPQSLEGMLCGASHQDFQCHLMVTASGGGIQILTNNHDRVESLVKTISHILMDVCKVAEELELFVATSAYSPFDQFNFEQLLPLSHIHEQRSFLMTVKGIERTSVAAITGKVAQYGIAFDYGSARDMAAKYRTLLHIAPVLCAFCVNSPLQGGFVGKSLSLRLKYLLQSGFGEGFPSSLFTSPQFSFGDYVRWAREQPLQLYRDNNKGVYKALDGNSFSHWQREGLPDGSQVEIVDWERHLDSIVTPVRVKRTLEFCALDMVPGELIPSMPTLLSGIVHHPQSLTRAMNLISFSSVEEYRTLLSHVADEGLRAKHRGRTIASYGRDLLTIAELGLEARIGADLEDSSVLRHLSGVEGILATNRTPADRLVMDWSKTSRRDPQVFLGAYSLSPSTIKSYL